MGAAQPPTMRLSVASRVRASVTTARGSASRVQIPAGGGTRRWRSTSARNTHVETEGVGVKRVVLRSRGWLPPDVIGWRIRLACPGSATIGGRRSNIVRAHPTSSVRTGVRISAFLHDSTDVFGAGGRTRTGDAPLGSDAPSEQARRDGRTGIALRRHPQWLRSRACSAAESREPITRYAGPVFLILWGLYGVPSGT